MKTLLPVILLFLSLENRSQTPTLTKAANEPVAGDTKSSTRFDSSGVIPKSTGANMSWNFSSAVQNTATSSSTFVLPGSVPAATAYPGATLAEDQGSNSYAFFKSVTTPSASFESLGFSSTGFAVTFTNSAVGAQWPISFGYANTDTYAGSVTQPVSGTLNGTINTTGSGSGTLTLPGGQVLTNVLQVKVVNTTTITSGSGFTMITGTITSTDYNYYHSSQKFEVLTVSYQKQNLNSIGGPTVNTSASISVNNSFVAGLKEHSPDVTLSFYPNPVSEVININASTGTLNSVEIYSQLGELVYSGGKEGQISVASLPRGIYFLEVKTDKGIARKKLIKE